ncbi:MAG: ABC transporter ATP-binding protein [candidate division Zixibacteria bacterium]|nr:ABC transporter ATP-binding protein [candidate division Zixibacteria bacterium]NIR67601.1 ABC transporter ATP-binding protein [candidate division Zixibacteria bacterium]NIS16332.1 ABC transporter ATP-binding protein [candidate division Zixibacteria bacterium]NIS48862.1 ABC transporter ATP-binding protein [candidate division Zixibacteria bacterium]NIT52710.1 ABC transporter ATP-binding protein [candidate division Zixibacteria bacterium]
MGVLEVKKLSLTLDGSRILNKLDIDFWEGHVHAVVGPNGAGKSTLAATIMGLSGYRDFEGDIIFKGESIKDLDINERAGRRITLAWQEPARFEGLTIRDFIRSSARDKSVDNLKRTLDEVGLDSDEYFMRAVDKTLSGGERKKVELASILAMEPEVALLDEPDSGIDIESIERIFEAVRVLKAKGTTVIMITHSLAVLNQAEHAFLMCNGTIVDKGAVSKIRSYFEDKCIPCPHKNIPRMARSGGRV